MATQITDPTISVAQRLYQIERQMRLQVANGDTEAAHSLADDLLVELLETLPKVTGGDESLVERVIAAYRLVRKWYA